MEVFPLPQKRIWGIEVKSYTKLRPFFLLLRDEGWVTIAVSGLLLLYWIFIIKMPFSPARRQVLYHGLHKHSDKKRQSASQRLRTKDKARDNRWKQTDGGKQENNDTMSASMTGSQLSTPGGCWAAFCRNSSKMQAVAWQRAWRCLSPHQHGGWAAAQMKQRLATLEERTAFLRLM